jgi:hypothetical protein
LVVADELGQGPREQPSVTRRKTGPGLGVGVRDRRLTEWAEEKDGDQQGRRTTAREGATSTVRKTATTAGEIGSESSTSCACGREKKPTL